MLLLEVVTMTPEQERQDDQDPFGARSEAQLCERIMGDRRHGLITRRIGHV